MPCTRVVSSFAYALAMAAILCGPPLSADEAGTGIDFERMPVGTWVVTQSISGGTHGVSVFDGQVGEEYVVRRGSLNRRDKFILFETRFFDLQGRLVRTLRAPPYAELEATVSPFSCEYALGKCTHSRTTPSDYVDDGDEVEWKTETQSIETTLDGQTLTMRFLESRSELTHIYELGDFNLRISRRTFVEGRDDPISGYDLVEIKLP